MFRRIQWVGLDVRAWSGRRKSKRTGRILSKRRSRRKRSIALFNCVSAGAATRENCSTRSPGDGIAIDPAKVEKQTLVPMS